MLRSLGCLEHDPGDLVRVPVDPREQVEQVRLELCGVAKQMIGDTGSLEMAPEPLDIVEVRAVRGQPEDVEPLLDLGLIEVGLKPLGFVSTRVIPHQEDRCTNGSSPRHQLLSDRQATPLVVRVLHVMEELPRLVVDGSEDVVLAVLPRCGNPRLLALPVPHPRQVRVEIETALIPEAEAVSRIRLESPFFASSGIFLAF